MSHPIRNMIMLSATALALIAAPVLTNQTALSDLQAIAKDKGNGGGNSDGGGGGGGGNGNGGGSENSNGGGGGGSNGQSNKSEGKSKKVADTEAVTTTTKAAKVAKTKTLDAQLAGLHSLKRNINGLMNSSDPRMTEIRQFIVASADLVDAKAILEAASGELEGAENDYLSLLQRAGIQPSLDITPTMVENRIGEIERILEEEPPEDPTDLNDELEALQGAIDGLAAQWAVVEAERDELADAAEDVAELEDATDAGALEDALRAAANRNRDVTDEVIEWASLQLGVGDADGLIDDYIERR